MGRERRVARAVLMGSVLGLITVCSAAYFYARLESIAADVPDVRPLIAPLVVLGSGLVLCLCVMLTVVLHAVRARGEDSFETRLKGARVLIALALLLAAISVSIIGVVLGNGYSPGTLILLYATVALAILVVLSLGAYIANFTRRWAS